MYPRIILVVALLCCGCGSYFTGMGRDAATGAVNSVTGDDSKKKLDGLVTDATKSARDEALGPNTEAALKKLIADLDPEIQKLVTDTGTTTRTELNGLITQALQAKIRQTIRIAIDEAFGTSTLKEADTLREELVGTPLQKDLNDLLDAAAPHLAAAVQQAVQSSLQPIKKEESTLQTAADVEAAKWKPIAIAFAIGCALLLVCLVFAYLLLRHHRQVIDTLVRAKES